MGAVKEGGLGEYLTTFNALQRIPRRDVTGGRLRPSPNRHLAEMVYLSEPQEGEDRFHLG